MPPHKECVYLEQNRGDERANIQLQLGWEKNQLWWLSKEYHFYSQELEEELYKLPSR